MHMRTVLAVLSVIIFTLHGTSIADTQLPSKAPLLVPAPQNMKPILPKGVPVVQKLTSDASMEVQQSAKIIENIVAAQRNHGGAVCDSGTLGTYKGILMRDTQVCMARTYTRDENISAGCTSADTVNSCSKKLFDWCMHRHKPYRDNIVKEMKRHSTILHNAIMFGSDKLYPQ